MGSSITDKNGYKKLLKLGMVEGMNSPRTAEAETEASLEPNSSGPAWEQLGDFISK